MHQLNFEIKGKPDKVILIHAPCRSGTSALLNAFAMDDIQSVYQPIKVALHRMLSGDSDPVIITIRTPTIVIKETLGPYVPEEVSFDPISVLLSRGIDPSILHVIALFRRPEECLLSWKSFFRANDIDYSLFGVSYEAVYDDCVRAQKRGVHIVPLRYEQLAEPGAFHDLISKLEIPFNPAMLKWSLSKKYRPGRFSFQDIPQPKLYTHSLPSAEESNEFAVRIPVPGSEYVPDSIIANAARLESARAIYATVVEDLSADRIVEQVDFRPLGLPR